MAATDGDLANEFYYANVSIDRSFFRFTHMHTVAHFERKKPSRAAHQIPSVVRPNCAFMIAPAKTETEAEKMENKRTTKYS